MLDGVRFWQNRETQVMQFYQATLDWGFLMGNLAVTGSSALVVYGEGSPFVYVSNQNLTYYGNRCVLSGSSWITRNPRMR